MKWQSTHLNFCLAQHYDHISASAKPHNYYTFGNAILSTPTSNFLTNVESAFTTTDRQDDHIYNSQLFLFE